VAITVALVLVVAIMMMDYARSSSYGEGVFF
jgi:hypothetical protein